MTPRPPDTYTLKGKTERRLAFVHPTADRACPMTPTHMETSFSTANFGPSYPTKGFVDIDSVHLGAEGLESEQRHAPAQHPHFGQTVMQLRRDLVQHRRLKGWLYASFTLDSAYIVSVG